MLVIRFFLKDGGEHSLEDVTGVMDPQDLTEPELKQYANKAAANDARITGYKIIDRSKVQAKGFCTDRNLEESTGHCLNAVGSKFMMCPRDRAQCDCWINT